MQLRSNSNPYLALVSLFFLTFNFQALAEGNDTVDYSKPYQDYKTLKREAWKKDPTEELDRLKNARFLTPEMEAHLQKEAGKEKLSDHCLKQLKIMYGRLAEIRLQFSKTHYVFTHAQSVDTVLGQKIFKKIWEGLGQSFGAGNKAHRPKSTDSDPVDTLDKLLAHNPEYSRANIDDHDLNIRKDLISADFFFSNSQVVESALHFLIANNNISGFNSDLLFSLLKDQIPDVILRRKVANLFSDHLVEELKKIKPCSGILNVLLVPKNIQEGKEPFYFARAGGCALDGHAGVLSTIKQIENLQGPLEFLESTKLKNEIESRFKLHKYPAEHPYSKESNMPQVRIFPQAFNQAGYYTVRLGQEVIQDHDMKGITDKIAQTGAFSSNQEAKLSLKNLSEVKELLKKTEENPSMPILFQACAKGSFRGVDATEEQIQLARKVFSSPSEYISSRLEDALSKTPGEVPLLPLMEKMKSDLEQQMGPGLAKRKCIVPIGLMFSTFLGDTL